MSHPVSVAVDGSESAREAVVWAAAEAHRRETWLRVVTVYPWPITGFPEAAATGPQLLAGLREQAHATLAEARDAANVTAPDLLVRTAALEGDVVAELRAASEGATLLVLGSRGLGGFSGMLLGSTAVALSAHGACPVVVVRGESKGSRVVVGVDGGPTDDAALAFAFEHAATANHTVVATHAWSDTLLDAAHTAGYAALDWGQLSTQAGELLADRVAPWRAKFPAVPVELVVARSRPARLLLEQAADAELVVVGSRGRGGFAGLLLGSTSQALIRHSPCPVSIVR
ncbi:universal stress protein [Actinokineospora diospyrosa]|uniref:Nucleotide-binding universal stress protein, UspA family n=1 Tax=Actinokineospora diospyrosa TaxID=103728 RepID=A0ABT1I6B8_9PSEU|nr:universal stress protein [Actinokineospora diospyrosa]MCP2268149.1 Nucleotide-binding universal stress protein, UspA family [Actinokineospora diospyrosa]